MSVSKGHKVHIRYTLVVGTFYGADCHIRTGTPGFSQHRTVIQSSLTPIGNHFVTIVYGLIGETDCQRGGFTTDVGNWHNGFLSARNRRTLKRLLFGS